MLAIPLIAIGTALIIFGVTEIAMTMLQKAKPTDTPANKQDTKSLVIGFFSIGFFLIIFGVLLRILG